MYLTKYRYLIVNETTWDYSIFLVWGILPLKYCQFHANRIYMLFKWIKCIYTLPFHWMPEIIPPWWDHVNHFVWIISDVQQKEILLPTLWAIFYHSFFNFLDFVAIELSGELSLGYSSQITFRRRKTLSFKQNYIEKCLIF